MVALGVLEANMSVTIAAHLLAHQTIVVGKTQVVEGVLGVVELMVVGSFLEFYK